MLATRARTAWMAAAALLVAGALRAEDCTNGLDDDSDGFVDCADDDCIGDAGCVVSTSRTIEASLNAPSWPDPNLYLVSWPDVPLIDDVAGLGPSSHDCVVPGGTTPPDGVIDSADVACALWFSAPRAPGDRIHVWSFDEWTCTTQVTTVMDDGAAGPWVSRPTFPLTSARSYRVMLLAAALPAPPATLTLRGWNRSSTPGERVGPPFPDCVPRWLALAVHPNSVFTHADELLCGQEGIDWIDGDGDGNPDTCPNGIFDGSTPISVQIHDNDPGLAPSGELESNHRPISRTALLSDRGLVFLGPDFPVGPGDGFYVQVRSGHPELGTRYVEPRR